MITRERTVPLVPGWRIVLPQGWVSLPTDPAEAPRAISGLLDKALEGKPRDQMIDLRVEIDRKLREQCRQAHEAGAGHLHSLFEPVAGALVSASLVGREFVVEDTDTLASTLQMGFSRAEGIVEMGFVDVGEHGALRRLREETTDQLLDGQPRPVATLSLDLVIRLDQTRFAVMSFGTTTAPLRDELVVLFDAIASTLHPAPPTVP